MTNEQVYHKWKLRCAFWRMQIHAREFRKVLEQGQQSACDFRASIEQFRVAMGALPFKKSLWQRFIGRMSAFSRGTSL